MITVIQRVSKASVVVNQQTIGEIQQGILAFIAVEKTDTPFIVEKLLERVLKYRIFADSDNKMNLSVCDIQGGVLLIPQFTLAANTHKGNRPSFASAAPPEWGRELFCYLQQYALKIYPNVQFGEFGADMKVSLINDGPVTFILKV